jgi:hypothetical protein
MLFFIPGPGGLDFFDVLLIVALDRVVGQLDRLLRSFQSAVVILLRQKDGTQSIPTVVGIRGEVDGLSAGLQGAVEVLAHVPPERRIGIESIGLSDILLDIRGTKDLKRFVLFPRLDVDACGLREEI